MVGIFITARLGSTRLSQKHLLEVAGRTFIEWLVARLQTEFRQEIEAKKVGIFITTSVRPENKQFNQIFKETGVTVFPGSDDNIPLRHLQCADHFGITHIISIDGDDILCSPHAARVVMNQLKNNAEMVHTSGLPLGMNVLGYRTAFLKLCLEQQEPGKLETGWGRIFPNEHIVDCPIPTVADGAKLRMTLDYKDDADFFSAVIDKTAPNILTMSDVDLIDTILLNDLYKINAGLNETYWKNFNEQKQAEQNN